MEGKKVDIATISRRYETNYPEITKVVVGNKTPAGALTNRREYYEVKLDGKILHAIDYMSALTTLFRI